MANPALLTAVEDSAGSGVASFQTTAQNHVAGATVLIGIKWEGTPTGVTITDTAGNVYTIKATVTDSVSIVVAYIVSGAGNAANRLTVTFTGGGTADFVFAITESWSNITSFDQSNSAHAASGTAVTLGSVTPTQAASFSWGFTGIFNSTDYTWNSGFIESIDGANEGSGYRIHDRSSALNPSVTQTTNDAWCGYHLVFNYSNPNPAWLGSFGAKSTGSATSSSTAYPTGLQSGNLILLPVVSKHDNLPAASGFTQQAQSTDGAGTGADTGSVVATLFWKLSDGTESGTLAVTKTTETGSGVFGQMFRLVKWRAQSWAIASTTGADSSTGTAVSVTGGATLDITPGDYVVAVFADVSDVGTNAWTSPSITATGCTFDTIEISQVNLDAIGDDMRLAVYAVRCLTGAATAAPVFSATANGSAVNSHRGAGIIARFRANYSSTATRPLVTRLRRQ